MQEVIIGVAVALAIEGVLYAVFPEGMKKMMMQLINTPSSFLRGVGILALSLSVLIVWVMKAA